MKLLAESIAASRADMLEANKNRWFEKVFAVYNRNLLRRRFDSLLVKGLQYLPKSKELPTVMYANHSSWWDGLVAFQISHQTKSDSFIMMEEKQLKQLPVFRKLGAFSVTRENPREARKSIDYAVRLLREKPNTTLWIFPQGEILPNDTRPLMFYNGLSRIIKKVENCRIVNLALRYEFLGSYKPTIFAAIAETKFDTQPEQIDNKTLSKILSAQLTGNLEQLKTDIIFNQTDAYRNII